MLEVSRQSAKEITEDLVAFVHRVATNEKATPAEIAALPEVAKVLLENVSARKI